MNIVIVGNGPINQKFGKFIDGCDVVVRFNRFQTRGFEEFVGSKTSIWCVASNVKKKYNLKRSIDTWIVERPDCPTNEFKIPNGIQEELRSRIKSPPSVGIVAIHYVLTLNFDRIYLVGFNGLDPRFQHHYYTKEARGQDNHDGSEEFGILNELADQGKIRFLDRMKLL